MTRMSRAVAASASPDPCTFAALMSVADLSIDTDQVLHVEDRDTALATAGVHPHREELIGVYEHALHPAPTNSSGENDGYTISKPPGSRCAAMAAIARV